MGFRSWDRCAAWDQCPWLAAEEECGRWGSRWSHEIWQLHVASDDLQTHAEAFQKAAATSAGQFALASGMVQSTLSMSRSTTVSSELSASGLASNQAEAFRARLAEKDAALRVAVEDKRRAESDMLAEAEQLREEAEARAAAAAAQMKDAQAALALLREASSSSTAAMAEMAEAAEKAETAETAVEGAKSAVGEASVPGSSRHGTASEATDNEKAATVEKETRAADGAKTIEGTEGSNGTNASIEKAEQQLHGQDEEKEGGERKGMKR